MADAWFANTALLFRHPRQLLDLLRPSGAEDEPLPAPQAAARRAPGSDDDSLPAIITRAQDDVRCRQALARMGYAWVRAEYAQQLKAGGDTFPALAGDQLSPPLEFVRDWLRAERLRLLGRMRSTFLGAMLVTVVAGLAFAIVLAALE